ncbi:hypothetical protein CHN50_17290 [Priestia aryabhattai]|nr:hypothetical protein CHN50_17290 [Priestia aryabhattai]
MNESKKYRIIVAHPAKQHSFKTASALNEEGILFEYITTVYDKPYSITRFVNRLLKGNLKKKGQSRKCKTLDDDKVHQFCEVWGLISILLPKIKFLSKYKYWWNNKLSDRFGRKVAKYAIRNNVDAVISYDYHSMELFSYLKEHAPHIRRILDVSIANRIFMKEIFNNDVIKTGQTGFYSENLDVWKEENLIRVKRELSLTSSFLVPSTVVKESILYSGINIKDIYMVPYGVNSSQFLYLNKTKLHKPLKLLYVGGIIYRKGIHHLFEVAKQLGPEIVEINLVGQYNKESELYNQGKQLSNIHFLGFITHDELFKQYRDSDFFIFPTLCEGYGLVVLEAMSCGMPVICSDHAGGNDIICEGENGYVFPTGHTQALIKILENIVNDPPNISYMSERARITANNMTWESYNSKLIESINEIMQGV